tara:strand:+ start:223 stop:984 length:762 start_codon:yes stop_codon:yes gene_type:complete
MATYTSLLNILPDPNNPIGESGQPLAAGSKGPGYASVKLASEHKMLNTRTNSGRLISRELSGHKWEIDISYNPMTRDDFEPVYSFLLQKRGSLTPFFVSLPQYRAPRDSTFATFVLNSGGTPRTFSMSEAATAGATNILIVNSSYDKDTKGKARPGDIFTISDSSDSNHKKVYQVTSVETDADYESGTTAPSATQLRVHFAPALQRTVATGTGSLIEFNNPLFRVVLSSDVQEYSLNTQNLYSFSLKLEEAQP